MKKIKGLFKNNVKILLAFLVGILVSSGIVYAATVIGASEVSYTDNNNLGESTVQGAIDKLYTMAANAGGNLGDSNKFVEAYTYNASRCVTGNESTCVKTECYKTKSAGACPAGTIIRYKVRPGEAVTFHVMYDDASTITMQSQRNTVYNTPWISVLDYSGSTTYGNDKGPLTILTALESATAGWVNVNDQTYTMGTTTFKTNAYTGCSGYNTCSANTYTLDSRTAKSRMITVQEAAALGCTGSIKSCPKWMNNYLYNSTSFGGTENDTSQGPANLSNEGYWTMSADSTTSNAAWYMLRYGCVKSSMVTYAYQGARAVVVVNKP